MPSSHLCENSGDCGFSHGPKWAHKLSAMVGMSSWLRALRWPWILRQYQGNSKVRAAIELRSQAHGAMTGAPRTPLERIQRTCNHSHSIDHLYQHHHLLQHEANRGTAEPSPAGEKHPTVPRVTVWHKFRSWESLFANQSRSVTEHAETSNLGQAVTGDKAAHWIEGQPGP